MTNTAIEEVNSDKIYEEKFKEIEERVINFCQTDSLKLLSNNRTLSLFEGKREEFISYEDYKIINDSCEITRRTSQIKDSKLLKDKRSLEILVNNLLDDKIPHMNLFTKRKDSNFN